ncbi:S8 family serine peptidase (plasmid) [Burkholderia sp. JSH-S8]|nr:S8 family serine peptidase [Burkholderia sp. JSH-S8]
MSKSSRKVKRFVIIFRVFRPVPLKSVQSLVIHDRISAVSPLAWSGALDQIASGSMPGDENGIPAAERPKRLPVVSTGNVTGGMQHDILPSQPIEDPSPQSWNALTLGGFTRKEQVPTPPPVMHPSVPANHRSPYSRGSCPLPDDLTPIKLEVLFEAGNMLTDTDGFCGRGAAVSLLSTGSDVVTEPLAPFWATSAAVGMAGNFTGRLQAVRPDLWPETHRALTVDSARWPEPMRKKFIGRGAGRWKSHVGQRRITDIARYALVISLSAPGHSVDLYAEIETLVDAKEAEVALILGGGAGRRED